MSAAFYENRSTNWPTYRATKGPKYKPTIGLAHEGTNEPTFKPMKVLRMCQLIHLDDKSGIRPDAAFKSFVKNLNRERGERVATINGKTIGTNS